MLIDISIGPTPRSSPRGTCKGADEPFIAVKEPFIKGLEPFIARDEPFIAGEAPCIFSFE